MSICGKGGEGGIGCGKGVQYIIVLHSYLWRRVGGSEGWVEVRGGWK